MPTQKAKNRRRLPGNRITLAAIVSGAVFIIMVALLSIPALKRNQLASTQPTPASATRPETLLTPTPKALKSPLTQAKSTKSKATRTPVEVTSVPDTRPEKPARIALIIDDFGYDRQIIDGFMRLDFPFTCAVLPHLPYSADAARLAHESGKTVILHLPMEPDRYPAIDPGPGALLESMAPEFFLNELRRDLDAVPHIVGVNNHMGSRLTKHAPSMQLVMAELKRRGLFFIDSKTIAESIAYTEARRAGVNSVQRDIFLDNDSNQRALETMFMKAIALARVKGPVVVIGHARKETLKMLAQSGALRERHNVELIAVQRVLN